MISYRIWIDAHHHVRSYGWILAVTQTRGRTGFQAQISPLPPAPAAGGLPKSPSPVKFDSSAVTWSPDCIWMTLVCSEAEAGWRSCRWVPFPCRASWWAARAQSPRAGGRCNLTRLWNHRTQRWFYLPAAQLGPGSGSAVAATSPRSPGWGFSSSLSLPFLHNKAIRRGCHWGVTGSVTREKLGQGTENRIPEAPGHHVSPGPGKPSRPRRLGWEFEWGHFVREWKLYILCYFNRLCLFSLREIVWREIGLSRFYFISKHLYTFPKISLLSQVINSCFTIILVYIISL